MREGVFQGWETKGHRGQEGEPVVTKEMAEKRLGETRLAENGLVKGLAELYCDPEHQRHVDRQVNQQQMDTVNKQIR